MINIKTLKNKKNIQYVRNIFKANKDVVVLKLDFFLKPEVRNQYCVKSHLSFNTIYSEVRIFFCNKINAKLYLKIVHPKI